MTTDTMGLYGMPLHDEQLNVAWTQEERAALSEEALMAGTFDSAFVRDVVIAHILRVRRGRRR